MHFAGVRSCAAARGHLLCCRSWKMRSGIACGAAPPICPHGARAKVHRLFPYRPLARISHRWSTTSPQSSALAVFRSFGLLDVLHEYDCWASVASLARTALAAPRYDKR